MAQKSNQLKKIWDDNISSSVTPIAFGPLAGRVWAIYKTRDVLRCITGITDGGIFFEAGNGCALNII
ncbi:MAG: hypothetical protein CM15mP62_30570 [Rhodospirillaceae bacterium]|nr:MAG: hypothetical protein CM15mP62_30570 [Rhodospirillaceae bacterium]